MTPPNITSAPYQRHSATSRAAAVGIEPMAGTRRAQVLAFLRDRGREGATDEEMQCRIPMSPNTQRPRRVELVQSFHVVNSGRTRATFGGDDAVVWIAAEYQSGEVAA